MSRMFKNSGAILWAALPAYLAVIAVASVVVALHGNSVPSQGPAEQLRGQSIESAQRKSSGCISCHSPMDQATMHPSKTVQLGCTDCHGGDSTAGIASGAPTDSAEYSAAKQKAHIQPRDPAFPNRGGMPQDIFAKWLNESAEYVKFLNPGDLRVAGETCGAAGCHADETRAVSTSMMTHT